MQENISLRECIDWMDAGLPFSFTCCSYDERRPKKSGKWITGGEAMSIHADRESSTEAGTDEQVEVETEESKELLNKNLRRNPNHRYHFTRNIRLCVGSKPVGLPLKIHLDLLTRFNGKKVILP